MSTKTAVIIGRFQPFHIGHFDLIEAALEKHERLVIVLGSANGPRSLRNPFTVDERVQMIKSALSSRVDLSKRVSAFVGVRDYFYNNEGWVNEVREKVREVAPGEVTLIGLLKDQSSSYLGWFSDWPLQNVSARIDVHASPLRENFFRDVNSIGNLDSLSPEVKQWLAKFAQTPAYEVLKAEQAYVDAYKKSWSTAPFPPVFVTTDILLLCNEHLLLIKRKGLPGRGLWANPGGFLDGNEPLLQCAIRELKEETAVDITETELKSAFVSAHVFDHPLRSSRGRTITHAHLFRLKNKTLPAFKAGDDAASAKWVPVLDIGKMEDQLFEDHFHIINYVLKR